MEAPQRDWPHPRFRERSGHQVHRARGNGQGDKKGRAIYGSQGRAVQVGTEMLIRMVKVPGAAEPEFPAMVRMSLRLHQRTFELINKLSRMKYNGDPGRVISACVKVLKMKRIRL